MSTKPRLWVPGDWNAFFGFGTNILVNLLTLTALLRSMAKPSGFSDGTNWKMASRAWRGSGLLYATARIADILPGSSLSKVP